MYNMNMNDLQELKKKELDATFLLHSKRRIKF